LDCRHVCKTCAFHNALQVGKQKEVHRTPLIWRPQAPDQGNTYCRKNQLLVKCTSDSTSKYFRWCHHYLLYHYSISQS
jgi:hypothetical protein